MSVLSDDISKWAGLYDFMLLVDIFNRIQEELGCVHTVDRFATITNRQGGLPFNAVACCSEVAEPDAFTRSWDRAGVDNWVFSPFSRVEQAIRHLEHPRGVGTVLVPLHSNAV